MATKKSAAPEPTEPEAVTSTPDDAVVDETSSAQPEAAVAEPVAAEPAVSEPAVAEPDVVESATPNSAATEAVVVEAVPAEPAQQVIVVDAPVPPKKKGNRGLGVALAFLATLIFAALVAGTAILLRLLFGTAFAPAVTDPLLYAPAIFFLVGLVLVTIILNRAGWWSHIIGSVVVGAIVWFGTAGLLLIYAGVATMTQSEANAVYFEALFSPIGVASALLAREVAIWTGAILARRGRTLKARNAEAHAAFEREKAELMPTSERAATS